MANPSFDANLHALSSHGPSMHTLQNEIEDMQNEVSICIGKFELLGQTFLESASSQSHPWQRPRNSNQPVEPTMQSMPTTTGKNAAHDSKPAPLAPSSTLETTQARSSGSEKPAALAQKQEHQYQPQEGIIAVACSDPMPHSPVFESKETQTDESTDPAALASQQVYQSQDTSGRKRELIGSIECPAPAQATQIHVEQMMQKTKTLPKKKRCSSAPASHASNFFDSMKDTMLLHKSNVHGAEPRRARPRTKAARFYEAIKDSRQQKKLAHSIPNLQKQELRASKFFSDQKGATNQRPMFPYNEPHAMMPVTWQPPHPAPLSSHRHSDSSRRTSRTRSLTDLGLGVDRSSFHSLLDEAIDTALYQ